MPRLSHYRGALTPEGFASALRRHPGLQSAAIEAARCVLVDGLSLSEAGRQHRCTRQRVHELVQLLHPVETPSGWVRRWISLPPDMMKSVIAMERKARRSLPPPETSDE